MTRISSAGVVRSGLVYRRVIVNHRTERNILAGLSDRIQRTIFARTTMPVDGYTRFAVNGFRPCFTISARSRNTVLFGISCHLDDTVLCVRSERITAGLRQILLYQLDIEHIAVVIYASRR